MAKLWDLNHDVSGRMGISENKDCEDWEGTIQKEKNLLRLPTEPIRPSCYINLHLTEEHHVQSNITENASIWGGSTSIYINHFFLHRHISTFVNPWGCAPFLLARCHKGACPWVKTGCGGLNVVLQMLIDQCGQVTSVCNGNPFSRANIIGHPQLFR